MTDTKNTEVPPASQAPAPAPVAAPATFVREKNTWLTPLVAALVVVATLVIGGVGGYALAAATHAGGRPAIHQGQFPGPGPGPGPQQGGPQQGGPQQRPDGPQGQGPNQPDLPAEESDEADDDSSTDGESPEG